MIPYMVGKLVPNPTHHTRGPVKYVPGRGYFGAVPSQNGDKFVTSPPLSIVELDRHRTDSSGVSFATVSQVFQESRSPPRGEPRVGGLQHWQLYPGTSFHVGTVDR